ncbi:MAG: anthranilate phosphoribosyltransferase [Gammaproteobacteria bacterium]|nr:anthranilate phosphoribosyltransferase [Gammaproteobacteria bacterium]
MNEFLEIPDAEALIRDAIRRVAVGPNRGRDISRRESELVMGAILRQEIDTVQAAVFLIALRMKSESMEEFSGLFSALQQSMSITPVAVPQLYALGDPFDGYLRSIPMTPFVPAVLAACGFPALITGVETVGPKHGITAHQVYRLAGIKTGLPAEQAAINIVQHGWAYLDQSQYAPQLYRMLSLRDRMVKRTAITTLERLLVPLRAQQKTNLVLGYVHKAYPDIYSSIAKQAGFASALLVKGVEGGFAPALNKPVRGYFFNFDLPEAAPSGKCVLDLPTTMIANQAAVSNASPVSESVDQCLQSGLAALSGERGTARDSLVISSAQIIHTYQSHAHADADSFADAVEKVQYCLDNGAAKSRFQSLIANLGNKRELTQ